MICNSVAGAQKLGKLSMLRMMFPYPFAIAMINLSRCVNISNRHFFPSTFTQYSHSTISLYFKGFQNYHSFALIYALVRHFLFTKYEPLLFSFKILPIFFFQERNNTLLKNSILQTKTFGLQIIMK